MKYLIFLLPVWGTILSSCGQQVTPTRIETVPIVNTGEIPESLQKDFGSGLAFSYDGNNSNLSHNNKTIKSWNENVKIRVEAVDSRFYKIYRDLENDFQVWVYDSVSGNIHEFGNANTGDIIEKIWVSEDAINLRTKYSPSKLHLNENPYNFPLGKVVGMYLTFSPDFKRLLSWQYKEYDRELSLEKDKELVSQFMKKSRRSDFSLENFQLKGVYFKNATYIGSINSGCFPDGSEQICMAPKFFVVIDNDGKVVYFDETNGDYECTDIEKSLSGKVLQSIGEKFCPNFPKEQVEINL